MADTLPSAIEQELLGIKNLLWGNEIKLDIFKRWSQGFYFSKNEQSALEQTEGGPCAIIAPVQAFILKNLLLDYKDLSFREKVNLELQNHSLVSALCEILRQCNIRKYYVVYLNSEFSAAVNQAELKCEAESSKAVENLEIDPARFHDGLKVHSYQCLDEVKNYYCENITKLRAQYGILLFLYSVIASKGLEIVKSESDTQDPLIDETYGYGSQSLINLMITGRATTYVWDHHEDVGGLKLLGIERQSQIGFITVMEYHRYCTVGSFYKNPTHPVWVVASDTHLTVLFSDERKLVSPETKSEQARRVFKSFDPHGNNFISSDKLQEVLQNLDLVSELEYVNIMKKKLDNENLGIILLNAFMDEFFPKEESSTPDMFTLVHYNGLARSNVNSQVHYHIGSAILLESDIKSVCESNPMLTVLQTKWPNIEVNWWDNITPSLN
ncbi:ubiquitin carboxyl-terminal hydrolase MINDY-3 homolog [Diabrotica virgifera virgifera]|uniref:Ubiquitin carboxyl-terminal hydrolase MINDY n=1 Tax=Diabrotica virgifera virgifera TaxID=50390 RepID=A0A6P7G9F5_DIAVI|nr:ubiquitin carboxyl-terminal hydrolase MINDY-3 homolog [Diabrotica virgifera virgifera]